MPIPKTIVVPNSTRCLPTSGKITKVVKMVNDTGQGAEISFGYQIRQFKCKNGCEHHNHLVCVVCGKERYLDSLPLENLQDKLSKAKRFSPSKHSFQLFGVCRDCQ